MTTLVVGATGATGRLLVERLVVRGGRVRVIVRAAERLPAEVRNHPGVEVIEAGVLDLPDDELATHVRGCGAIASCLGHNLSLRGVFGPPWRLVAEATRRLCAAARANANDGSGAAGKPVRFVLMSSAGVRNPDEGERVSAAQRCVVGLIRVLIPPHADNEAAAAYLRREVGPDDPHVGWALVRPDTLVDADAVGAYDVHPSPTRSAIFNAGKTSRINVADFMARLIEDDDAWARWRGRMPVVYNREA